jgi:hypothetical protein
MAIAYAGGLGIFALLCGRSAFNRAEQSGAAMVLGAGLVSLASFLLGLVVGGWSLRLAVSALCIGSLVLAARREPGLFAWPGRSLFTPSIAATALVAAAALGLVTWVSLYHTDLGWDGLFNWEAKSRAAFLNRGAFPISALDSSLSHPRYPLLVPLFGAWIYGWLGRVDQSMLKLVGPYFYLAALLLVIGSARRLSRNSWAGIVGALLLAAVPQLVAGGGGASSGYADWPLAVVYVCAMIAVDEYTRSGSPVAARLAGAAVLLGLWTKADMLVLLFCAAAAIAPRVIRNKEWRSGLTVVLPGICLYVLWSILVAWAHAPKDGDFGLRPHFDRVYILLRSLGGECLKWAEWSLFWPLLGLTAPFFFFRRFRPLIPLATGVFLPLILYPLVFVFSGWNPVRDHVASALPRLLLHIVPAAAILIVVVSFKVCRWDGSLLAAGKAAYANAEELIQAAAVILEPTGLTVEDLRRLYLKKAGLAARKQYAKRSGPS